MRKLGWWLVMSRVGPGPQLRSGVTHPPCDVRRVAHGFLQGAAVVAKWTLLTVAPKGDVAATGPAPSQIPIPSPGTVLDGAVRLDAVGVVSPTPAATISLRCGSGAWQRVPPGNYAHRPSTAAANSPPRFPALVRASVCGSRPSVFACLCVRDRRSASGARIAVGTSEGGVVLVRASDLKVLSSQQVQWGRRGMEGGGEGAG